MSGLDPPFPGAGPLREGSGDGVLAREYRALVKDVVELVDWTEQWERAAGDSERPKVEQLRQRLLRLLVSYGIRPTARLGAASDLRYHQIVGARQETGAEPDAIVEIVRMGYEMLSRGLDPCTIRQAKVIVAGEPAAGEQEGGAGDGER